MHTNLQFPKDLFKSYESFKEKSLTQRRFKHSDIKPLIERLTKKDIFQVDKAGVSTEGREIYLIKTGNGRTKLFLWSQMHGDEPTATAALFDIFNFFLDDNSFAELKKQLLAKLTIYFLPMVNPDGAELFQRRNIFEIDINRDAVSQQTIEGKLLRNIFETLNADFGFNLHDQGRNYSAGNNKKSAGISFLAPSPDISRSVTPVRERAMKLISQIYIALNEIVPGHIAKYSDEYEPRAFGDNFTTWGTSTILVESGGWKGDREKQFLRKMNFIALLTAFKNIADEAYKNQDVKVYDSIPENKELMMDLILRNLVIKNDKSELKIDIGINYEEINFNNAEQFYLKAIIEDIGDLSVFTGYEEIDMIGHIVEPGKTYSKVFQNENELKIIDVKELFSNGFTNVILNNDDFVKEYSPFAFNIILKRNNSYSDQIKVESIPNLIIRKNNKVCFAVVNGFIFNVSRPEKPSGNALIIRGD
jgi:hypothetical protein